MAQVKVERKLRNEEDLVEVKEVTGNVEIDGNLTVSGRINGEAGGSEKLTFTPSFTNTDGLISLTKYSRNDTAKELPLNGGYFKAIINSYDFLCNVFIEFYNTNNLNDVITKGTSVFNMAPLSNGFEPGKVNGQLCRVNGFFYDVNLFGTFPVKIMDANSDNLYSATVILFSKASRDVNGFIYKIVFEEDIPAGTKMLFSQNITLRRAPK